MVSLLLAIIYISFISLGLPDSLAGAAWPVMHLDLGVPVSYAGIVTMIIAAGTIISSLLSDRLNRKLGTGVITAVSVFLTALALFGFSSTKSFYILILWCIPYGLGAGGIDAALNNYVALHYASRHMSWLHCFWGVGASISPYIMGFCLINNLGWSQGYRTVSIIQFVLTACLFIAIPLWKKVENQNKTQYKNEQDEITVEPVGLAKAMKITGVPLILVTFFSYCALEQTTGLWACTYLVQNRGVSPAIAAKFASFFYLGITAGRFISGFVANKFGDKNMIRIGIVVAGFGTIMTALPFDTVSLVGLIIIGFGCAPIYPSVIHSTPSNFGRNNSQAIIGIQMATAYMGTTLMPPLFGLLAEKINIALYPYYLLIFTVLMLFTSERLNKVISAKNTYK